MESAILFIVGSSIFDESSTTSTSQTTTVSGVAVLILAWIVCAILIITGRLRANNRIFASGIIGGGIMTIATPLAYYISETLRLAVFPASVLDFLLLAGFSALGGVIIAVGTRRMARHRSSPEIGQRT